MFAGLCSVLLGTLLFSYYSLTRNLRNFRLPFTQEQLSDALKGTLGEAVFSSRPQDVNSEGLIEEYRKNPQKFKRYALMLDTAMNAKQVGYVLSRRAATPLPRTSESLAMDSNLKVDAWGRPFCIIDASGKVAVVSGGPSKLSCDALQLTPQQIISSAKDVYAGPSDVVVVIAKPEDSSNPGRTRETPTPISNSR